MSQEKNLRPEENQRSQQTSNPSQEQGTDRREQSTERSNPRTEELNEDQIQETNGGGLLGDDSSTLGGTLGGNIGISNTDEDGDTSSTNIDLGLGGILDSRNND